MALTKSQNAAVNYGENLIIFAGPGSGKTSTSVSKGVNLLSIPDIRLCMVTFTSASADETRTRMFKALSEKQLAPPGDRFMCGTFHSLALRHFMNHATGKRNLIKPGPRTAMIDSMLPGMSRADRMQFTLALEKYQGTLNQAALREKWLQEDEVNKKSTYCEFLQFIDEYNERLRHSHAYDFSIMMRDCATMIRDGAMPPLPISHLIGDEMQDADEVQLEFVMSHTRRGVITTLVADDDQCIYVWRSALGYPGLQYFAREANAKTIALQENFRSRSEIVEHAKTLIAHNNPDRIDKDYKPIRGPGGTLGYKQFGSLKAQCEEVASMILELRKDNQTVAVLGRTNAMLAALEPVLSEAGISYKREGKSIWESPQAAVLLSTLKALVQSDTYLLQPVFGMFKLSTNSALLHLEEAIGKHSDDFLNGELPDLPDLVAADRRVVEDFATKAARWRRALDAGRVKLTIPEVIDYVFGLYSNGLSLHDEGNDSQLIKAREREQRKWMRNLFVMYEEILLSLPGTVSARVQRLENMVKLSDTDQSVKLLTMHSSKGLEFDIVFLIGASNEDDGKILTHEADERRLFYVALTRAKEQFYCFYSDRAMPFIFESEIPALPYQDRPKA
ncbi:MAG: ATP-dependent helicase [Methylotenera sp.]|nr:ATP-dependent helicase [Methylotenera sp.]